MWAAMPNELVYYILDFCEQSENVKSLRLVNKRLHQMLQPVFWEHVQIGDFSDSIDEQLYMKEKTGSGIVLNIDTDSSCDWINLDRFAEHTKIASIDITSGPTSFKQSFLNRMGQGLKWALIKTISEPGSNCGRILEHDLSPSVKKVLVVTDTFSSPQWYPRNTVSLTLKSDPTDIVGLHKEALERLVCKVECNPELNHMFFTQCKNLKVLEYCSTSPTGEISQVPRSVETLSYVDVDIDLPVMRLDWIKSLTLDTVRGEILRAAELPNLEQLAIKGDYRYSTNTMNRLAVFLSVERPQLRRLDLSGAYVRGTVALLTNCKAPIETLLIRLDPHKFILSKTVIRSLRMIVFGEDPTGAGLDWILANCHRLEKVYIDGNTACPAELESRSEERRLFDEAPAVSSEMFRPAHYVYHDGFVWHSAAHKLLYRMVGYGS